MLMAIHYVHVKKVPVRCSKKNTKINAEIKCTPVETMIPQKVLI